MLRISYFKSRSHSVHTVWVEARQHGFPASDVGNHKPLHQRDSRACHTAARFEQEQGAAVAQSRTRREPRIVVQIRFLHQAARGNPYTLTTTKVYVVGPACDGSFVGVVSATAGP